MLQFKIVEHDEQAVARKCSHNNNGPQRSANISKHSKAGPPPVFNPFTDIKISSSREKKPYSSFHCVKADQSGYPDYMARTCEYRNLYYRPSDQTFHYYARPLEIQEYMNASLNLADAMTVADGFLRWDNLIVGLHNKTPQGVDLTYEWAPKIEKADGDFAAKARCAVVSAPVHPVFVLYLPSYSFNLGHLVFDDMLSIFAMLHMFGYALEGDTQTIPFFIERANQALNINFGSRDPFWRCHPQHAGRWNKCIKLWTRIYPPLLGVTPHQATGDILRTGNWLRGSAAIGEYIIAKSAKLQIQKPGDTNTSPQEYVLLPTVIYGPGRLANWSCKGECAIGRGLWLWEFRRYLLDNIFGRTRLQEPPNKGFITISLPVGTSHEDKVTYFEDVIEALKARYDDSRIKAVDMATLSMADQALLVQQSAIYITNHGGGSASAVFLQRGATLIIYHGIGKLGEPKMLDQHFWNSMGYIRVLWVHPNDHHNIQKSMNLIQYGLETFPLTP
jgi:hypothetical protein